MAFSTKAMTVGKTDPRKTFFAVSFRESADATGCETILTAHATKPYFVERLLVGIDFDGYIDFGDGEDTSAVETVALMLIGTATGLVYDITFKRPIKLTAAKDITIDASSAGILAGIVEGFYVN